MIGDVNVKGVYFSMVIPIVPLTDDRQLPFLVGTENNPQFMSESLSLDSPDIRCMSNKIYGMSNYNSRSTQYRILYSRKPLRQ